MLVTNESVYSDLVNNYQVFHDFYSEEDLLNVKGKWEDDTDYSNYQTIEELLENLTPKDYSLSHTVSVDIKDIFSSEESLGGCDRPVWSIKSNSAIAQQRDSLNRHGSYRQGAAQVLSGMLRPHPTISAHWVLVKYIGNNRVAMKLLANGGKSTRVLMNVSFHDRGLTQKQYIAMESDLHATDAGDRSGQNESQKFISGFRADRENELYTFNFLQRHKYNYNNIMQQEGVEGSEDWISISSLQGIKSGEGNGSFQKYGKDNMGKSLETIKKLCGITGEKVVGATPVMAFALMYRIFTEYGKSQNSQDPLFTDEQLESFFVAYFKEENRASTFGKKELKVNDLSMSASIKDIAYICGHTFWPTIVQYWMQINDVKTGFSNDCYASQRFLDWCTDKNLKKELRNAIS